MFVDSVISKLLVVKFLFYTDFLLLKRSGPLTPLLFKDQLAHKGTYITHLMYRDVNEYN